MGGIWAIVGDRIFRQIWLPIFFLFFAIPLPQFLYQGLSAKLQLLSSELGVSFIRLCDISVYQEGNVIDLGAMKLQVVEACSGLRYLFPLMSLAFMCAYFFKATLWKRVVIFLSSIPITVFMNSFRIGLIGVNRELSERRAVAVRDYLIGKGVPASRLSAKGYGESRPRVANTSPRNRAVNRRIEFRAVVE